MEHNTSNCLSYNQIYRSSKKNLRPVQHKSEFHAALQFIERNACSDIVEEDSYWANHNSQNHSSSINVVCNPSKNGGFVSPSNLPQHVHVNRLQASTSFEMLPITPSMILEEKPEQLMQKKCAAVQTTVVDESMTENCRNTNECNKDEAMNTNPPKSCRCPNCKCSNCYQADNDLVNDENDDSLRGGHSISDDDSGTESLKEDSARKLSVSSFAKSSASVLIHSCFVAEHDE